MMALLTSSAGRYLLGAVAVLALLGGVYLKGRSDGKAVIEAEVAEANRKADAKAASLSNELVIQQAIAMSATAKKASGYAQQIRSAPSDVERMRVGSRGVRDIITDAPAK